MSAPNTQLTPMMAQYRRIKGELPADALLLFRLGDFYEMFFEDAKTSAEILNVALTKRGLVPMCGIPFHAASGYISKLLAAGKKVAVCDQVEEAKPGQLVKREVTQILSPGTHFDERMLQAERNNYLVALCPLGKAFGLAALDLTTADFRTTELENESALLAELHRLRPAELLLPSLAGSLKQLLGGTTPALVDYEDWVFAPETAQFTVKEHFKVAALDGFGLKNKAAAIGAAGAILHYVSQHLRRDITHLARLSFYQASDFLILDYTSLRNLEVLEPMHKDAARDASLFGALNRTVTPMGARRLRDWLSRPLSSLDRIHQRQDAIEAWLRDSRLLSDFRERLKNARDLERTISRLTMAGGNGRDLVALRLGLEELPQLKAILGEVIARCAERPQGVLQEEIFPGAEVKVDPSEPLIKGLASALRELPEVVDLIQRAIVDEPPLAIREGGVIRDGYHSALDELRSASRGGKDWVAQLQQREIEATGIPSLKIRFNSVFGYYIEITKANLDRVPANYIRKQTIANGERFITPELKEMESKILGADERGAKLEHELFQQVRETIVGRSSELQELADALAQLDALSALAETARLYNYIRPVVRDEGALQLQEGRHPVLDQAIIDERFVPNDTDLSSSEQQIMLITGPNMAGKSTYIRQVALLALLAHTGSFIPAAKARIDLLDRIFTRIGASDDLSRGQSTFMVEMSETANILNNATNRSLVILDEIGRGTSTFDGLSLAWAIVEHLHNQVGAKTLFATHYHELTELAGRLPRIRNYNVAVREWNEQIIFLRKIVAGGTDKSYGIQVARLAGVPKSVLSRAGEILSNLEENELSPQGKTRSRHRAEREKLQKLAPPPQLDLFA